jgi:hypothetical protein
VVVGEGAVGLRFTPTACGVPLFSRRLSPFPPQAWLVKRSLTRNLNRSDRSPRPRSGGSMFARGRVDTPCFVETSPPALELFAWCHFPGWLHVPVVSLVFTTEQTVQLLNVPLGVNRRVSVDRTSLHCPPGTVGGAPAIRNALAVPFVGGEGGWYVTRTRVGCFERNSRSGSWNSFLLKLLPRVGGGLPSAWRPDSPRRQG